MKKTTLKQRLLAVVLVCLSCNVLIFPGSASVEQDMATISDTYFDEAINQYLLSLDALYYATFSNMPHNINNGLGKSIVTRQEHIQDWTAELQIKIVNQETSYEVKSILDSSSTQSKLIAYFWTDLWYINNGEENNIYKMGYGTDHILSLEKSQNGNWSVVSDAFVETVTGYQQGSRQEIEILQNNTNDSDNSSREYLSDSFSLLSSTNYNAEKAIEYSARWCGPTTPGTNTAQNPSNYNPAYYYYSADCANFVSQCLAAGGLVPGGDWSVYEYHSSPTPRMDTAYTKTGIAWRSVAYMSNYFRSKGYNVVRMTSADQALPGNPFYYEYQNESGGIGRHVMLIVGTNSNGMIVYNAHNNDAYQCLMNPNSSTNPRYTIEILHSYYYTAAATTHTKRCSICGESTTQNHTWMYSAPYYICTVCGYKTTKTPDISR